VDRIGGYAKTWINSLECHMDNAILTATQSPPQCYQIHLGVHLVDCSCEEEPQQQSLYDKKVRFNINRSEACV
jgi:hypothetical protein